MNKELIYMENWENGTGGWGGSLSKAAIPFNIPTRIFVNHPLAKWSLYSPGNIGFGIRADKPPVTSGELEIKFWCMPMARGRNILSMNVRDKNGNSIYKYSFGSGGLIEANKQPLADGTQGPIATTLKYDKQKPYELISNHIIGSDNFTLSLRNLLDDTIQVDPKIYECRGTKAAPAWLDLDAEGNMSGPAYLGKIEVYKL